MRISQVLAATVEGLSRAHAAAWVLSGRPLIYGARLVGPLKIAPGSARLLVARVLIVGDSVDTRGIVVPLGQVTPS